jgi:hypothetical protein
MLNVAAFTLDEDRDLPDDLQWLPGETKAYFSLP